MKKFDRLDLELANGTESNGKMYFSVGALMNLPYDRPETKARLWYDMKTHEWHAKNLEPGMNIPDLVSRIEKKIAIWDE